MPPDDIQPDPQPKTLVGRCLGAASAAYTSKRLPWIILAVGALFRIIQYAANRSLWLDEIKPAMAVISMSFSELARPIASDHHIAPIGFLWIQKALVSVFGPSEYVFRFVPLLAGLLSLYLLFRLARRVLHSHAVPLALALFACSDRLIYYAAELKPYSTDVLIAIALVLLILHVEAKPKAWGRLAVMAVVGPVAIWLSHPAIFVLVGIAVVTVVRHAVHKEWGVVGRLCIVFLPCALSFLASYHFCLRYITPKPTLHTFWRKAFLPFPPRSFADVAWPLKRFLKVLKDPVGLMLSRVGIVAFVAGCIALAYRRKAALCLLIAPLLLTVAASAFHKYPFSGRVLLFLVPGIVLILAEGAAAMFRKTERFSPLIGIAFAVTLLVQPAGKAMGHAVRPRTHEEIKPVLAYIDENLHDGDTLYLYHGARAAFRYYRPRFHFDTLERVSGVKSKKKHSRYIRDLRKLRERARAWILFSHVTEIDDVSEEQVFLDHLDKMGKRLDTFKAPGAAVYLYDLRRDPPLRTSP